MTSIDRAGRASGTFGLNDNSNVTDKRFIGVLTNDAAVISALEDQDGNDVLAEYVGAASFVLT